MGMHTQHYTVLAITDPSDNQKKQVEFEMGVCRDCRTVGYIRTSTLKHGSTDDERIGLCNPCFEKAVPPVHSVSDPEEKAEKETKKDKGSSRGR